MEDSRTVVNIKTFQFRVIIFDYIKFTLINWFFNSFWQSVIMYTCTLIVRLRQLWLFTANNLRYDMHNCFLLQHPSTVGPLSMSCFCILPSVLTDSWPLTATSSLSLSYQTTNNQYSNNRRTGVMGWFGANKEVPTIQDSPGQFMMSSVQGKLISVQNIFENLHFQNVQNNCLMKVLYVIVNSHECHLCVHCYSGNIFNNCLAL